MKNIKIPLLCALASGIIVAFATGAIKVPHFPSLSSIFSKATANLPFAENKADEQGNYIAVYLVNGKVYFGKFEEQSNRQFIIAEVFFLQSQKVTSSSKEKNTDNEVQIDDQQSSEMEFQLVRLADQFYAPEDRLTLTKDQILFWEPLEDDSKVVEAIKTYKGE